MYKLTQVIVILYNQNFHICCFRATAYTRCYNWVQFFLFNTVIDSKFLLLLSQIIRLKLQKSTYVCIFPAPISSGLCRAQPYPGVLCQISPLASSFFIISTIRSSISLFSTARLWRVSVKAFQFFAYGLDFSAVISAKLRSRLRSKSSCSAATSFGSLSETKTNLLATFCSIAGSTCIMLSNQILTDTDAASYYLMHKSYCCMLKFSTMNVTAVDVNSVVDYLSVQWSAINAAGLLPGGIDEN